MGHACPIDVNTTLKDFGLSPIPQPLPIWWSPVVWKAHENLANQIWNLYNKGELPAQGMDSLKDCFVEPISDVRLSQAINDRFLQGSLSEIKKINPKKFDVLSQKYRIENMAFRVLDGAGLDHKEAKAVLSDLPAGFNIETRTLFFNISNVSRSEWNVIFIHEMGHFIDPIEDHIEAFNNPKTVHQIDLISANNTIESLSVDDGRIIDEWLMHGLNIGLLAEWRVWNFTVDYLSNATNYTFGPRSKWLQPLLKMNILDRKMKIFAILDNNIPDPTTERFSDGVIPKRLKQIRIKLRNKILSGDLQNLQR